MINEQELNDAIELAAQTDEKQVDISLAGVAFMTSSAITMFMQANMLAKSLGVEVRLTNASPNVLETFKITRMNKLFKIEGEAE